MGTVRSQPNRVFTLKQTCIERVLKHSTLVAAGTDYFKKASRAMQKGKFEEAEQWFSLGIEEEVKAEMPN